MARKRKLTDDQLRQLRRELGKQLHNRPDKQDIYKKISNTVKRTLQKKRDLPPEEEEVTCPATATGASIPSVHSLLHTD